MDKVLVKILHNCYPIGTYLTSVQLASFELNKGKINLQVLNASTKNKIISQINVTDNITKQICLSEKWNTKMVFISDEVLGK